MNTKPLSLKHVHQELHAMQIVYDALDLLDDNARDRVLKHVAGMLGMRVAVILPPQTRSIAGVENV